MIDAGDNLIERLLSELSNIHQIYEKGNIIQKHTLIRGCSKIIWCGLGECLERLLSIQTLYDNVLKVNEKGLLFYEQPSSILGLSPVRTQRRSRTGTVSHRCLRPARLPIPPAGHWFFRTGSQMYLKSP